MGLGVDWYILFISYWVCGKNIGKVALTLGVGNKLQSSFVPPHGQLGHSDIIYGGDGGRDYFLRRKSEMFLISVSQSIAKMLTLLKNQTYICLHSYL